MKVTIDITNLAAQLYERLEPSDEEMRDLRERGGVPDGWSHAILDILTEEYNLEGHLQRSILETQQ